jgi:hypothetical protein
MTDSVKCPTLSLRKCLVVTFGVAPAGLRLDDREVLVEFLLAAAFRGFEIILAMTGRLAQPCAEMVPNWDEAAQGKLLGGAALPALR